MKSQSESRDNSVLYNYMKDAYIKKLEEFKTLEESKKREKLTLFERKIEPYKMKPPEKELHEKEFKEIFDRIPKESINSHYTLAIHFLINMCKLSKEQTIFLLKNKADFLSAMNQKTDHLQEIEKDVSSVRKFISTNSQAKKSKIKKIQEFINTTLPNSAATMANLIILFHHYAGGYGRRCPTLIGLIPEAMEENDEHQQLITEHRKNK
jgi:hypothetical protein